MSRSLRFGVCQTTTGRTVDQSVALAGRALKEAATQGCELLMFPELFLMNYGTPVEVIAETAERSGDTLAQIRHACRETKVSACISYAEHNPAKGGKPYNSVCIIDGATGEVVLNYRKTHLWSDYEHSIFTPGDRLGDTVMVKGIRVGLLLCFDVEFPENVRALAQAGVELVLVPTALTGAFNARVTVPSRAFENQLFVAYANEQASPVGAQPNPSLPPTFNRYPFCGLSCVVAPDGEELIRLPPYRDLRGEGYTLEFCTIRPDEDKFAECEMRNPYLSSLRPALYEQARRDGATKAHFDVDRAAAFIARMRKATRKRQGGVPPLTTLPRAFRPLTMNAAYAVQNALVKRERRIGYKIGATSAAAMKLCSIHEPFYGTMFESHLVDAGKGRPIPQLSLQDLTMCIVEPEVGVRFGRTPEAEADGSYTVEKIFAALDAIAACVEIVDSIFGATFYKAGGTCIVADNGVHGRFIRGPIVPIATLGFDVCVKKGFATSLVVNGTQQRFGETSALELPPIHSAAKMATLLRRHGRQMQPGEWISTGTITPVWVASAGEEIVMRAVGLGEITFRVVDRDVVTAASKL
jgi:predicted amidohydrolase/2-keto-4-pentenoate hydratase